MFLEEISNPTTIVEAPADYGRKLYFDYRKIKKGRELLSSPRPMVLHLGTWRMTDKQDQKKTFVCGLNLAYLSDEGELAAVQQALPDILKPKNMKTRYKVGKELLPDIFRKAYRTYNVNNIVARPIRGRLYALTPSDEDKEEAERLATRDGFEWDELENQERNQYLDQAVRKRGSEDVERQRKSQKEREQIDALIKQKEREEPEEEPELKKPKPSKKPPLPKPPKKPPEPKLPQKPKAFEPLDLGPGYEPEPEPEPEEPVKAHTEPHEPAQSPLRSIATGMATPQKLKIKKPEIENPTKADDETQL
jgi:hypothetical protein